MGKIAGGVHQPEVCFVGQPGGVKRIDVGGRARPILVQTPESLHPTQKPVFLQSPARRWSERLDNGFLSRPEMPQGAECS